MLIHLTDEPALQFVLVFEPELRHPLLGPLALAPFKLGRLVPADVNEPSRKEVHNLRKDIFHEGDGGILDIEHALGDSPVATNPGPGLKVPQFWISGNGRHHVAGHINFRNERDVAPCCKGDDLPNVILRVIPAIRGGVISARADILVSDQSAVAARADLGKKGILLDLDPPALIFSQMEMADVEAVKREEVNEPADIRNREKVAADIKMLAAPAEPGAIIDLHTGQRPLGSLKASGENGGGQKLAQCLNAARKPGGVGRLQAGTRLVHIQDIALIHKTGLIGNRHP